MSIVTDTDIDMKLLTAAEARLNDDVALGKYPWIKGSVIIHLTMEKPAHAAGSPAWYWQHTHDLYLSLPTIYRDNEAKILNVLRAITSERESSLLNGFIAHEAAHSQWSEWMLKLLGRKGITAMEFSVITMLEELRIEKRAADKGAIVYLRHSFGWLLEATVDGDIDTSRMAVAHLWALCFGRFKAGIATEAEVRPIDDTTRTVLGDSTVDLLVDILDEAVETANPVEVVPRLAKEWIEVVKPEPGEGGDISIGVIGEPCAADHSEKADGDAPPAAGEGEGSDDDADDAKEGEGDAPEGDGSDDDADAETPSASPEHGKGDTETEELLKKNLTDVAEEMEKPFVPEGGKIDMADPRVEVKVFASKKMRAIETDPSPVQRGRALRLSRTLEQLALPTVTRTPVPSDLPPGRLRSREMVRRGAEKSMGMMSTATPWERSKRTRTTHKPIIVGVMTDTSSSMSWAQRLSGEFAWTVARAGIHIGARTAAVTFGNTVHPVAMPGEVPMKIRTYPADGYTEMFNRAAAALDGVLHLSVPNKAAKLLFIVSDGVLVEPNEGPRAAEWIKRFQAGGTGIVWIGSSYEGKVGHMPRVATPPGVVWVSKFDRTKPDELYGKMEGIILNAARTGKLGI